MAEEVGYPFNQIPTEAFISAAGGYGAGTLCGTLGVGAACIGTVCDKETSNKLLSELLKWYKKEEFPSYQPENLNLPKTVADSYLCEDSVGNFMAASGYAYNDPERKSRCAGVAAEVTKKIFEMLNEQMG
ncbi:split-soret cytochrome c precursor [Oxobacter pfennigii]|uniref:Split-soret cytochrome c n=1 Tax=Oxobacter pfennigii TaxID=36849 RepID=A0A0P8X3G2_9CLOT|nr:split-soret cytochrome c precursor [Oxobacter pfennigii]